MSDLLLWCDLETTGLDPDADQLLEVAAVITDSHLKRCSEEFTAVVRHDNAAELRERAVPVVQQMHDRSGLWGKLADGVDLAQVETDLLEWMGAVEPSVGGLRLAGSSVGALDLPFVKAKLPRVAAQLHYRTVDVSAVAFVAHELGWVDGFYPKAKRHEALADIEESIAELAWIDEHIRGRR